MSSFMSMSRRFWIARAIIGLTPGSGDSRSTSEAMVSMRIRSAGATPCASRTATVFAIIVVIIWAGSVPGSNVYVEGNSQPSTYTFEPGTDPTQMITTMIAKTVAVLDAQGVASADRMRMLTIASLVERESPDPGVSPMMARAIQNRLDIDMKLDIDASVAYGLNKSGTELTTADLEDPTNPYNTYLHPGLPPGPIASPGEASIDAVLHPADGPWKFWVTINPDTKETLFAETYDEQLANQELLREWQAANGG